MARSRPARAVRAARPPTPACCARGHDETQGARSRVEQLVRCRFRLDEHAPIRVEQRVPPEPNYPPLETRITFWRGNDREHQYRVFKPIAEVCAADLPPWWYRDALILDIFPYCDCCG